MRAPADFVVFVVAVIAYISNNEIAYLIGPYAAITLAACAGAALALSSSETLTLRKAISYVCIRIFMAIVLTVSLSELLQEAYPEYLHGGARQIMSSLPIIAFAIGVISDYKAAATAVVSTARNAVAWTLSIRIKRK